MQFCLFWYPINQLICRNVFRLNDCWFFNSLLSQIYFWGAPTVHSCALFQGYNNSMKILYYIFRRLLLVLIKIKASIFPYLFFNILKMRSFSNYTPSDPHDWTWTFCEKACFSINLTSHSLQFFSDGFISKLKFDSIPPGYGDPMLPSFHLSNTDSNVKFIFASLQLFSIYSNVKLRPPPRPTVGLRYDRDQRICSSSIRFFFRPGAQTLLFWKPCIPYM